MQKCILGRQTLKIKVVLGLELCNFFLDTARIMYASTYDNGAIFISLIQSCKNAHLAEKLLT